MFNSGIRSLYTVLDNPTFVSEPWAVYPAKRNRDGKLASVFIFDKKRFESQINALTGSSSNSKNPKVILSECYELIKFELSQAAKLKHPQILTILEPLEETKLKFLFVSEPVVNNLKTVSLQKLDDLTIQKGLLQVSKSLQFLHNFCHIIHFNLQPSSIFINDQGDWKLSGFRFLHNLNDLSPQEIDNFYIMNNSSAIPFTNLNLNFTAPELLLDSSLKLGLPNDIWSLGCIIYFLYNQGEYLVDCFDSDSISDYKTSFKRFENRFYNRQPIELKHFFKNVPEKLFSVLSQMLSRYPHDRLTIDQFIDSDFFNGSIIKAMWFVDEFATKTTEEKLIFMKGTLEIDPESNEDILTQFPATFRSLKFLPLMIELIVNELKVLGNNHPLTQDTEDLLSLATSITLKIGSTFSNLTFQDRIYSILFKSNLSFWKKEKTNSNIFKVFITCSIKIRLSILENLGILKSKLSDKQLCDFCKQFGEIVLASTTNADSPISTYQIQLQELYLKELPSIISIFEFPYIKNTLFPLICLIFKTTTVLSTKLATIQIFVSFVDNSIIDKLIVVEQLLPILNNLKSRDKNIVGHILELFEKLNASEHISLDIETLILQVLPQCLQLTFGCNNCTADEFKSFMNQVQRIENTLVERKLQLLPKHVSDDNTSATGGSKNDFESLVNSQKFNQGNKDEILKAPQTRSVMQPTQRRSMSSEIHQEQKPKSTHSVMSPISPRVNQNNIPKAQNNGSALKFGATSNKPINNNALLQTLNNSSLKSEIDDDFDDFQSTSTVTTPTTNNSTINWNIEANKAKPMNNMKALPNPIAAQPNRSMNSVQPTIKLPPGFDSNLVLSPSTKTSNFNQTTSHTTSNSNDVLDFL